MPFKIRFKGEVQAAMAQAAHKRKLSESDAVTDEAVGIIRGPKNMKVEVY